MIYNLHQYFCNLQNINIPKSYTIQKKKMETE